MQQQSFIKNYCLFLFILIVSLASCNSGEDKASTPVTATENNKAALPVTQASLTGGYLDTLWVTRAVFDTMPKGKKLVFSFTFGQLDTLTMHGWILKNNSGKDFDNTPNISLVKGRPDKISTYGSGTYFGNIILQSNDINAIQKKLKDSSANYVLFAPLKDAENIRYKIFVGKDNPSILVKTYAVIPTGAEANPSPPKNY